MYDYYFTFRSVTTAMKGSRILERAGIKTLLSRTPKMLQQQGCGYCLKVRAGSLQAAQTVLLREDVRFNKIYRKEENGRWQEVLR